MITCRPLSTDLAWSPDGSLIGFQSLMPDGWFGMVVFDFHARKKIGYSENGLANHMGGLSWAPHGHHLVTALDWRDGSRVNADQIIAWLINESASSAAPMLFVDSSVLETASTRAGFLTNPQWQPRPP